MFQPQGHQEFVYPQQPRFEPAFIGAHNDDMAAYGFGEESQVKGFDFSEKSIRSAFIRKVFFIMTCQLLITAGFIAVFLFNHDAKYWVAKNPSIFWVALVVLIVTLISMACCDSVRRKAPMNFICLFMFTLAESFLLGMAASVYEAQAVIMAVGITAAICLALTFFAFQTKWDFTAMGGILLCGIVVLILFGMISIFLPPTRITTLVYASIAALLFSFYLVYDIQLMMGGKHKYSISPEEYIFAALNLYLDIINIFSSILDLVSASRD